MRSAIHAYGRASPNGMSRAASSTRRWNAGAAGQIDGHGEEGAPAGEVLGDLLPRQVGEPAGPLPSPASGLPFGSG